MKKILFPVLLLLLTMPSWAQHRKGNSSNKFAVQRDLPQISLWPDAVPDGPGPKGAEQVSATGAVTNVSHPRLIVHLPENANGTAILVMGGGGYARIERGRKVCRQLTGCNCRELLLLN